MGLIYQINVKQKTPGQRGIPKMPVEEAELYTAGFQGDYNVYRTGWKLSTNKRAVLIMPKETIEQLANEGWEVKPGDLGENISSQGISYEELRIGTRIRAGRAIIEITEKANPCKNLEVLPYIGKERVKEFMKTLLERRGMYAKVLQEGLVRKNDELTII
ncbi:MAG: MOSC domain-containing protein [Nanoarchaeota archaeon]